VSRKAVLGLGLLAVVLVIVGLGGLQGVLSPSTRSVPHEDRWGIYALDLATGGVELLYSSSVKIAYLRLNGAGDRFIFSQKLDGETDEYEEICAVGVDGSGFARITENRYWDLYPCWSPNGSQVAFLTWRDAGLDIYVVDADGDNKRELYDSGGHDADIDWVGGSIVFTVNSRIWIMRDDGTEPMPITDLPNAGEWGDANLPFGDYDPRLSPDGSRVVFERLWGDSTEHGNYDLYVVNSDGTDEVRLTESGYSQGLAAWSHSGDELVYLVAAINGEGKYDIYLMDSDGTDIRNITPDYFPDAFLCHSPNFSKDDSRIYFIGEWWE
jgi:Tol biopolymer transport system component